jgi:hypothetical protein
MLEGARAPWLPIRSRVVQHKGWWSCGEGSWEFGSSETTALFIGGLCFTFAVAQVSVA